MKVLGIAFSVSIPWLFFVVADAASIISPLLNLF
jgi:hypothetical protein